MEIPTSQPAELSAQAAYDKALDDYVDTKPANYEEAALHFKGSELERAAQTETKPDTAEAEAGVNRIKAVAYAVNRINDDQAYWEELQKDVEEGRLPQSKVLDTWTREMNRRWVKRSEKDPIRFGTQK